MRLYKNEKKKKKIQMCQIYKFCDYCGAREYSLMLLIKSVVRHQARSCTL